ncbi:flagellar biosynthesis protein FlgN [Exiguobacterium sp. SH0S7]|uniref:flagellar export chaperone FlgN n=1 Tax=Exiguobacterium sp. SH0S7 TaxID=2510951 RepID=UPI00103EB7B7|nr:flagellar export chaperone FlgN [Exiguobacterium sp. SH0S7]TCI73457.1 flagellar biosynthesis protein FlgN [Exiguobacterium sp. SH0S7]
MLTLHTRLLELAYAKEQLLIKGDMPAFSALVKEEATIVRQIGQKETERLQGLLVLDDEEKEALRPVLFELKRQNELNATLLEQSLRYINWHLDMLVPEADDFTYGQQAFETRSFSRDV